jgi:hypothetical protein
MIARHSRKTSAGAAHSAPHHGQLKARLSVAETRRLNYDPIKLNRIMV